MTAPLTDNALKEALEKTSGYPQTYIDLEPSLDGPEWLQTARRTALATFLNQGFPGRKDEEWKYTSVRKLVKTDLTPASEPFTGDVDLAALPIPDFDAHKLVFVNGHFRGDLSAIGQLPDGLEIRSISEMLEDDPDTLETYLNGRLEEGYPFADLNTAFFQDGAFIKVSRSKIIEKPIHLVFVAQSHHSAPAIHPRTVLVAAENSQVQVVETWVGDGNETYFTNAVTDVHLGDNAVVDHVKVEDEASHAYHIAKLNGWIPRSANFRQINFCLGGGLVRNDINTALEGEGASCLVNGLYLPSGNQHVDNHTSIDHKAANCESHQLYKGIMHGRSTAVFNGKIFVREGAQNTNADQSNPNLLLSENSHVDTKPQLEIWADDVRCTHGATIGQLEENALFYMKARGIPERDARALLTFGFANAVVEDVRIEDLREHLEQKVRDWFNTAE